MNRRLIFSSIIVLSLSCGETEDISFSANLQYEPAVTIVANEQTTAVAVDSGDLAGAQLKVVPGTIPLGSEVTIGEAPVPDLFKGFAAQAGSRVIAYAAKDKNGKNLDLVAVATLAIPIKQAPSIQLPEITLTDNRFPNLCVLMKPHDNRPPRVWRRNAIVIESNTALVETRRLGLFQVVYCGQNKLTGFEEVGNSSPVVDVSSPEVEVIAVDHPEDNRYEFITMKVTFSEPVIDFNSDDIVVVNGDKSNFSGSEAEYSFEIKLLAAEVLVDIPASVAKDNAGNGNVAANQWDIFEQFPDLLKNPPAGGISTEIPDPGEQEIAAGGSMDLVSPVTFDENMPPNIESQELFDAKSAF